MKRFLVTILSILYLASAMGATVEFHYCMGHNMGANFVHKSDDKCRKCGMHKSKSKGCCHDEHKTIKTSEHNNNKAAFNLSAQVAILPQQSAYVVYHAPVSNYSQVVTVSAHAPPKQLHSCPVYILFRNLRI